MTVNVLPIRVSIRYLNCCFSVLLHLHFFRIEIFRIWVDFPWSQSAGRKIEWNSIFCFCKNDTDDNLDTMDNLRFLHLFYRRFGNGCIRIACSCVVIDMYIQIFSRQNFNIKWECSEMLFAWHRLPFDHKNPFGFVAAIAVMYATFSYLILIGACNMIAAIEFYVYLNRTY